MRCPPSYLRAGCCLGIRAFYACALIAFGGLSLARAQAPPPMTLEERVAQQEQELQALRAVLEARNAAPPGEGKGDFSKRFTKLEKEWSAFNEAEAKKKERASQLPTMKLGGQIVLDALWFSQNDVSRAAVGDVQDALDFRRARLYVNGDAFEVFNYAMGFDFAQGTATNGRPTFLDNYVGVTELPIVGNLRIGHFFEPFMLERSSSNRNTMFMERSIADAFAPARNTGVMIFDQSENQAVYWALGSFRGASDNFGDDAGDQEGQTIDGRFVYRPYYDEATNGRSYLHLGGGYSFRDAADGVVQFRSRPEAFANADVDDPATPFFADTGTLAAHYSQLAGVEFLMVQGPVTVQAEYVLTPVNRTGGPDTLFNGGYANVGYFLTGEHRPYNRAAAIPDRVIPFENFFRVRTQDGALQTGSGAWEVAARLSYLDLNDQDVQGGVLRDVTLGLNWYASPYHRVKFNYVHAHLDRNAVVSNTDIFGIRFDADF
jgi:phosphate-selective porin OprO/OprP